MRGTVYHHRKFGFHDGNVGKKYIILLNSPSSGEPYLFVKVTSQQHGKPTIQGCIIKRKLFYIPCDGKYCFKVDTWVQLHELYEFTSASMVKDGLTKELTYHGKLSSIMINGIVNCYVNSNSDDLLPYHRKLLTSSKSNA